jgi:tetratricopeptide (TPR) repeat protein
MKTGKKARKKAKSAKRASDDSRSEVKRHLGVEIYGPPPKIGGKAELKRMLLVFSLAFVLRMLYFFLDRARNPLFAHPIMDSLYHSQWAERIVDGDFWGKEVFFRAPLYPYFLALLYKLSGSSIAFAVFVQHIIGSLSAVLLYVLARLYFARRVALTAGLLAALYWPFIYFEGQLLIVTTIIFLDLCFLIMMSMAFRSGKIGHASSAGLLLGLSAVARPSVLVMVPIIPLLFFLHGRITKSGIGRAGGKSAWMRMSAACLGGAFLVIAPVIVRNYVVGRDLVPIASQGGVNFYIGNNPSSDGRTAIVPGTRPDWWGGYYDSIDIAEKSMGRKLKPSEISNFYFRKGFEFIFSSPGKALQLFLHKFRLFWSGGERANNQNIYFFWHLAGMGKVPLPGFWFVCPLGLLGAFMLRRRIRSLSLLYAFMAAYSLGVIIFFVCARFRLPVVPLLILFAAYALNRMHAAYLLKEGSFAGYLALLVAAASVVNLDFATFKENKVYADVISHYTLGNAYLKEEEPDRALAEYEKALANYRKYGVTAFKLIARNVYNNLGTLYWKRGRCREAVDVLNLVGGNDVYASRAKRYAAECYAKLGERRKALQAYGEALRMSPDDRDCLLSYARFLAADHQTAEARKVLARALSLYPGDVELNALASRLSNHSPEP